MAGFADILGSLVQSGLSGSSGKRITNAFGGKQGGMGDILGNLGDMFGGGQSGQGSQGGDLGSMVGSVLGSLGGGNQGSSASRGQGGLGGMLGDVLGNLGKNQAAIGGLGALAGALLGKKGAARGAIGGGTLAILASLAMSALKKSGQQAHQSPAAFIENPTVEEQQQLESEAEILVKAMINAAKADGQIDQQEFEKIVGKLDDDGITEEEKAFFQSEIQKPIDIEGLAALANGRPELAAQIYAASLLAIEVDTVAEQQYMNQLASALNLNSATVQYIEETLAK